METVGTVRGQGGEVCISFKIVMGFLSVLIRLYIFTFTFFSGGENDVESVDKIVRSVRV